MPSTWTHNYYHVVFGTKNREPWLTPEVEARLHPFLGGIAKDLNCTPYAINGFVEHVHVAVRYPSELSHSDLARHLKSRSSKWIHESFPTLQSFSWQEGYGGFTVSKSIVPKLVRYIENQKEHHKRISYVDEFVRLHRAHGSDVLPKDLLG